MRPAAAGTTTRILVGLLGTVKWQQLTESQHFGKPHPDPAMARLVLCLRDASIS